MPDWLFLDMDNYFASVEQQAEPALRGRPVGIVPVKTAGTCCIAVSREAKRLGIRTGTGVIEAKQRCPGIVLVEARPKYYVQVHHRIVEAVTSVLPVDKVESIDELAVCLLGDEARPERAMQIGKRMKAAVREAVGDCLTCSVGIAPTRMLAKTMCELAKPDGLRRVDLSDLPGAIGELSLDDLPGINKGIKSRLSRHGVCTVRALWDLSVGEARRIWGSVEGVRYWMALHGQDPPRHENPRRSFGHANVLSPDLRSRDGAHAAMTRLLHKAAARLRHYGYLARTLSAGVSFKDRPPWSTGIHLPTCQDTRTIIEHFERLWATCPDGLVPMKVSVTLGQLLPADQATGSLFGDAEHRDALGKVMDQLNTRYGKHVLYLGGMHTIAGRDMPDKIAFGRVPDEGVAM